jgi:hypothetical protein
LSCVGRGLASGRSPVQGVLPIVYRFTSKNPSTPQGKRGRLRKKEKAYDSVRGEVLYNIPIEFVISMTLIRLIKMCLNATYRKILTDENLSDGHPTQNGLNQGNAISLLLSNFALKYIIRKGQEFH